MRKFSTRVLACMLGLVCMGNLSAQNGADILINSGPCDPIIPLLCSSGVQNPENATDNDINSYATLKTEIGLLSGSFLKVGFSNPAPQGSVVAFYVESEAVLNADLLASLTMRLFNAADEMIAEKLVFTLADIEIDETGKGILKLKVPKGQTAVAARLTAGSLLTLSNEIDVYGAVHAPASSSIYADYIYDGGPCNPVTLGCNSGVLNAMQAIDANKNNYAGLVIPFGVSDHAFLDLGFSTPGPASSTVTFTLGTNGTVLGLDLLSKLRLTIFDSDGNVIRNKRGFSLAEVELIGSYQFRLKLKVPNAPGVEIARARVTLNSLVGVLSEVLIYNISYTPKIYFSDYFRQDNILAKNEILVYPNPASEMLMVQKADNNTDDTDIYIYASDGKLMLQELHHSENIISIKINTLPDGMYILNAKSGNELYTKTFIVEN